MADKTEEYSQDSSTSRLQTRLPSSKDLCSLSDDDDCIALDSNTPSQNSLPDTINLDENGPDDAMDQENVQMEISELGLKIQDIVSLTSPAHSSKSGASEIRDTGACFAISPSGNIRRKSRNYSSDCSVIDCFDSKCSHGDYFKKKENTISSLQTNGGNQKLQPFVPLIDILRKPLHSPKIPRSKNPAENEDEDCVVIENDAKTQDIIVVDDLQESDGGRNGSSVIKSSSGTVNLVKCSSQVQSTVARSSGSKPLESDSVSILPFIPLAAERTPLLKRSSSQLDQDGSRRKIPRTATPGDLLILEYAEEENLNPDVESQSAKIKNSDANSSPPSAVFLIRNSSSADDSCSVSQSSESGCVLDELDGVPTGERSSPSRFYPVIHRKSLSTGSTKMTFHATSRLLTPGGSNTSQMSSDAQLTGPVSSDDDKLAENENVDVDSSSSGQVVSSSLAFQPLVSYDLSDTDDGSLSCDDVSSSCHAVPRNASSGPCPMGGDGGGTNERLPPTMTPGIITKESFYGSGSLSNEDIFPKQYDVRRRTRMRRSCSNEEAISGTNRCIASSRPQEDVVHISSDEEDASSIAGGSSSSSSLSSAAYWNSILQVAETAGKTKKQVNLNSDPVERVTKKHHRRSGESSSLEVSVSKVVYRSTTIIPLRCQLMRDCLEIHLLNNSLKIKVEDMVLLMPQVKDGRIVFSIPSAVAKTLDDFFQLHLDKDEERIGQESSRLTLCLEDSTPVNTLMDLLDQISIAGTAVHEKPTEADDDPADDDALAWSLSDWKSNFARRLGKYLPKRVASWARPRHWNKPFFSRYVGSCRTRFNFHSQVADNAFISPHDYDDSWNDLSEPVQVSGFSGTVVKLFTYPPPPAARGIAVTNEDLFCLNAGEYVNDVIIDFYLKYLFNEILSEEDRTRTHVFSSFFYGHLVSVSGNSGDNSTNLSVAEQRHQKVRTWTRNIDIFSKDFIIVPINENFHWFLAIVCFPGLRPEISTDTIAHQLQKKSLEDVSKNKEDGKNDGEDVAGEVVASEEESQSTAAVIKKPCILIFDSLQGDVRWDVARSLREYLQVEWDKKKTSTDGSRLFQKDLMKGCRPSCPQQPNYSDCGLYLLQYVEAFFKKPLKDFTLPIRYLSNWFDGSEALAKRSHLHSLILELTQKLNPDLDYDPLADGCFIDTMSLEAVHK